MERTTRGRTSTLAAVAICLVTASCVAGGADAVDTSSSVAAVDPDVATGASSTLGGTLEETTTTLQLRLVLGPHGLSDTLTFGSDGHEVVSALAATFGPPVRDFVEELRLLTSPIGGNIYGDASDGLGILSEYPFYRDVCWDAGLCIEMDSEDGDRWIFVTWRYSGPQDGAVPLFTAEGIGVGSTFGEMRAAYPEVSVDWGEGESTGFTLPGWDPAFNGALVGNGTFDFNFNPITASGREELLPDDIPDSVTVRTLYVGDGVDYGCC